MKRHYKNLGFRFIHGRFFLIPIYCQVIVIQILTHTFQLGAAYQGDFITNLHGGINSGGGYSD
ncbi:MAG: hypothetical protein R2759_09395 [Bacteroidales bacterium]